MRDMHGVPPSGAARAVAKRPAGGTHTASTDGCRVGCAAAHPGGSSPRLRVDEEATVMGSPGECEYDPPSDSRPFSEYMTPAEIKAYTKRGYRQSEKYRLEEWRAARRRFWKNLF